jgi:hypothetical protein
MKRSGDTPLMLGCDAVRPFFRISDMLRADPHLRVHRADKSRLGVDCVSGKIAFIS